MLSDITLPLLMPCLLLRCFVDIVIAFYADDTLLFDAVIRHSAMLMAIRAHKMAERYARYASGDSAKIRYDDDVILNVIPHIIRRLSSLQ